MQWLKHAFAIPSAAAFVPTQAERELVSRLQIELSRRHLLLPATVLLETSRPLAFVASQAVIFSTPWFAGLAGPLGLKVLAGLLERPGGIDWILDAWNADETTQKPMDDAIGPTKESGLLPNSSSVTANQPD